MTEDPRAPRATDEPSAAVVDDYEGHEGHESYEDDDGDSDDLPSTGLLSFYDRLRERILTSVDRRGGKLGAGAVKVLLLAPDLFMLLARLTLDKNVPASTRALVGGALAYFILPTDLLPEALLGVGGYTDDVVLAAAVLSQVFTEDLEPFLRKHWSGPQELRVVLQDVSGVGRSLLGENLYLRLKGLLARRGVEVVEASRSERGRDEDFEDEDFEDRDFEDEGFESEDGDDEPVSG